MTTWREARAKLHAGNPVLKDEYDRLGPRFETLSKMKEEEVTTSYPTRCRILDVSGEQWRGLLLSTPPVSQPHVGKEGLAELEQVRDGMGHGPTERVKITLDDGTILYGYECWWKPISNE